MSSEKCLYVYILTNKPYGTLYVGVTSDPINRMIKHKKKEFDKSFSAKYEIDKLVYLEAVGDPEYAIKREKRIKKYKRSQKIKLIEKDNPYWVDLYQDIIRTWQ